MSPLLVPTPSPVLVDHNENLVHCVACCCNRSISKQIQKDVCLMEILFWMFPVQCQGFIQDLDLNNHLFSEYLCLKKAYCSKHYVKGRHDDSGITYYSTCTRNI